MTSFTHVDDHGDALAIESDPDHARAVVSSEDGRAVYVPKDDAPAVALAILTAAGWEPEPLGTHVPRAVFLLKAHGEQEERKKRYAEAARKAEEAKLTEEALALLNAATDSCYTDFAHDAIRETWLRAARRARELHS
ncbi:hypothetical protein SEA_POWERPUFF_55 [Arthrobacter phage Powerpuff]|nr:hypothetical protein SEA_POWERPUFF_55 [Arthrobacter phage Powerpuff]QIN94544.1 hypothetical protein SEA_YESCHEF_53 [Arthrobacter phage YesChef]